MKFDDTIIFPQIPIYPVIDKDYDLCEWPELDGPHLDRVQFQFDPTRRAILVRHIEQLHWCGYVPVNPTDWRRHADSVRAITGLRITYEGYSTQHICWMSRNQQGKFKLQTPLLPGTNYEDDSWVGFDAKRHPIYDRLSDDEAIAMMYGFENTIWSVLNGRLAVGG